MSKIDYTIPTKKIDDDKVKFGTTLPGQNNIDFENITYTRPDPHCNVVQTTLQNCTPFQPFIDFFKFEQSEEELNKRQYYDVSAAFDKAQKQRDHEISVKDFDPTVVFNNPEHTRIEKNNITMRSSLGKYNRRG
tara:strand:+ start:108 stop:509 length:402 start_codon:yes stop_codon:yes gene_type:complete